MALYPYLVFNGNAREAALFYAQAFGSPEPQILTFGSIHADEVPAEVKDLVMHTYVEVAGSKLMMSDDYPGNPYQQGNNFTLAYVSKDEAAIRSAFEKLKEGGVVEMELQETPWSKVYGMLTDKFNVKWQFNLEA